MLERSLQGTSQSIGPGQVDGGSTMLIIQFYKSVGEYGYLSNLFPCNIELWGRVFPSAEHAYQYRKFKDRKIADWAMTAPAPRFIAILAHGLFPYDVTENWTTLKIDVMREVLFQKFRQNPELFTKLKVETEGKELQEASKSDKFWGIGKKGDGQNMLGKLLMELRDRGFNNA